MESYTDWLYLCEPVAKWAGGLIVLGGVWRFFIMPIGKFTKAVSVTSHKFTESLPILLRIAEEFRPNGGNSLRDIVDRIENSMALSNQRNRAIFSYFDIAVFETDSQGAYTFVSKDWCALTGLSTDQASGEGWINAVAAESRDTVMLAWKRSVAEKREFALEYRIYTPGGHGKTMLISSRAFPSRRGYGPYEKVVGIIGIIRPVTITPMIPM